MAALTQHILHTEAERARATALINGTGADYRTARQIAEILTRELGRTFTTGQADNLRRRVRRQDATPQAASVPPPAPKPATRHPITNVTFRTLTIPVTRRPAHYGEAGTGIALPRISIIETAPAEMGA